MCTCSVQVRKIPDRNEKFRTRNTNPKTLANNPFGVVAYQPAQFKTVEILIIESVGNYFWIFSGPH
jgi:hypothetical protein